MKIYMSTGQFSIINIITVILIVLLSDHYLIADGCTLHWCQEWDSCMDEGRAGQERAAAMQVCARPPSKFSATTDFNLWIQRFELYLKEAEIPVDKRARELVSLLEDGLFRVISQLGLV